MLPWFLPPSCKVLGSLQYLSSYPFFYYFFVCSTFVLKFINLFPFIHQRTGCHPFLMTSLTYCFWWHPTEVVSEFVSEYFTKYLFHNPLVVPPGLEPGTSEPESDVLPIIPQDILSCCPTRTRTWNCRTKICRVANYTIGQCDYL